MRSCTKSNDELVMEMQRTYDEQQSNMDDMIRQVALLIEMMKEIQENRARSEVNESREKEEGVKETEKKEPIEAENKSEALPEKLREVETVEIESDEKETLTEGESITTPPGEEALQKTLEEGNDEPQEKEDGAIKHSVEVNNTLFCLQSRKVHVLGEKVEDSTTAVEGENAPAEKPPPMINKSEGCCYEEEEPELREGRPKRKAARFIYWVQLQPWPEPLKTRKPPNSGYVPRKRKRFRGRTRITRKIEVP